MMVRRISSIAVVLLAVSSLSAQTKPSVESLLDIVGSGEPIHFAERQAAKDALIALPYNEVLPKLAVRISKAPPQWSIRIQSSGTGRGLGDEKSPPGEQAIWALNQVWHAHTSGAKPDTFGSDLVKYLNDEAFVGLRERIVFEIGNYWVAESEEAITKLFNDEKSPVALRYCAARTLMYHARAKNLDAMLTFIQANPMREGFLIRDLMSVHRPRLTDDAREWRLLIAARDQMEREIQETGRVSTGYFTALAMGNFIGTRGAPADARDLPNPFKPGQDEPGMKRADGNLSDAFFEAPVHRARAWWKENEALARKMASQ
jgi:hypothetical protein